MKNLLIVFLLSFLTTSSTQKVYICTGPTAYAYHKYRTCRGLNRCTGEIKQISLEQAKSEKRRACKICFKRHEPKARGEH